MIVSSSAESTSRRLTELLLTVDLQDSFLQWHAQLLANYSGHIFVPHTFDMSMPTLWQDSLTQLSMQAEIADLRSQIDFLKSEQQQLKTEIKGAEVRRRRRKRMIQKVEFSKSNSEYTRPSTLPKGFPSPSLHRSSSPSSSRASTSTFSPFTPFDRNDGILYAMLLLRNVDDKDRVLSAQHNELAKSTQQLYMCGICMDEMPENSIVRPDSCGHAFCRDCLRGHIIARLDEHKFPILCPSCTAGQGKGKGAAGGMFPSDHLLSPHVMSFLEVSQSLALNLGLTDEQFDIWVEMEMVAFSVLLSCRMYARSFHSTAPLLIVGQVPAVDVRGQRRI